jgi:protein O-mannosyl-transferase
MCRFSVRNGIIGKSRSFAAFVIDFASPPRNDGIPMIAQELLDRCGPPAGSGAGGFMRMSTLWQNAAVCLFLALAVWAVFGQTIGFAFVNYDDNLNVYENGVVAQGLNLKSVGWAFAHAQTSNWIPLTTLSHMLDCQLFGLHAAGHHLVNVLWHAAAAALLFLLLREMTGALWRSAFVAALFAIHPLRAESVAWVSERKDVLSGFFFMLTIWAYVRYSRRPSRRGYLAVMVIFAIGLLSKIMLVTLPGVLLLLDYWPLDRLYDRGQFLRLVKEKIPLLALALGACVVSVMVPGLLVTGDARLPLSARLADALVSSVIYVRQMVFPAGLAIPYPNPPNGWPGWEIVVATLLLAAISAGALAFRKKRPYLLVGWFWYLVMLIPVAGIVPISLWAVHADRYTYLPEIGLAIAGSWAVADWSARREYRRAVLAGLMAVVICALMYGASRQTAYWRDSETLWTHSITQDPSNSVAFCNLGSALSHKGETKEAIRQYERALQINPGYAIAHCNLGNAFARLGKMDQAVAQYRKALDINPDYAEARSNLGNALVRTGKMEEAFAQFQKALDIWPDYAEARFSVGAALAQAGRDKEAIAQYRKALDIWPDYAEARFNLGFTLAKIGQYEEAIGQYRKALEINPRYEEAHYNLGRALARQGAVEEAVLEYRTVLELNPGDAEAHSHLGLALAQLGRVPEAVAQYRRALEIKPAYAEARGNLASALARTGQTAEAIAQYRQSLEIDPDQIYVQNSLAWLLATASDASLRNGAQAVALAEKANQTSGGADPLILRTLAAAYAETGRFQEASVTVRRALALAVQQKNDILARTLPQQIELYEAGTPMHAPK